MVRTSAGLPLLPGRHLRPPHSLDELGHAGLPGARPSRLGRRWQEVGPALKENHILVDMLGRDSPQVEAVVAAAGARGMEGAAHPRRGDARPFSSGDDLPAVTREC